MEDEYETRRRAIERYQPETATRAEMTTYDDDVAWCASYDRKKMEERSASFSSRVPKPRKIEPHPWDVIKIEIKEQNEMLAGLTSAHAALPIVDTVARDAAIESYRVATMAKRAAGIALYEAECQARHEASLEDENIPRFARVCGIIQALTLEEADLEHQVRNVPRFDSSSMSARDARLATVQRNAKKETLNGKLSACKAKLEDTKARLELARVAPVESAKEAVATASENEDDCRIIVSGFEESDAIITASLSKIERCRSKIVELEARLLDGFTAIPIPQIFSGASCFKVIEIPMLARKSSTVSVVSCVAEEASCVAIKAVGGAGIDPSIAVKAMTVAKMAVVSCEDEMASSIVVKKAPSKSKKGSGGAKKAASGGAKKAAVIVIDLDEVEPAKAAEVEAPKALVKMSWAKMASSGTTKAAENATKE